MSDQTTLTAAEKRAEEAGKLLARLPDGAAAPGDLAANLGWNGVRQAEAIKAGRARGWFEGPKTRVQLTREGWARFGAYVETLGPQGSALAVLDDAFSGWPEVWRAFARLLVSAMVFRHHHGETQPTGHLAFVVLGPSGTGKSSAAGVVMDLFGWGHVEHTLLAHSQAKGALLGRSESTAEGIVFRPAPETLLPLLLVDELGKSGASEATSRAVAGYGQGNVRVKFEGELHTIRPTVILAANPPVKGDRFATFPPEYRRRAVVLDTEHLRSRRSEIDDALYAWEARSPRPRLSLEQLRPPKALDNAATELLRSAVNLLTDAGRELADVPSLRHAALGCRALLGESASDLEAVLRTVQDYLTVTETVPGEVSSGWREQVARVWGRIDAGESVDAAQALERSRQEAEAARQEVRREVVRRDSTSLAVRHAGEVLAARLERLRDALEGRKLHHVAEEDRWSATALRKTLSGLLKSASAVSTQAALEEVTAKAEPYIVEAEAILGRERQARAYAEQAKVDAQRQAQQAKRSEIEQRRWQRQSAAAQRKEQSARLESTRQVARELERLYKRKRATEGVPAYLELEQLSVLGYPVGCRVPLADPGKRRGLLDILLDGGAPTHGWRVLGLRGEQLDWMALSQVRDFGEGTRATLRPWLDYLYQVEAGLEQALGRKPRPRLTLTEPAAVGVPRALPSRAGVRRI